MVCCGGVRMKWSAVVVLERTGLLEWRWNEMVCWGGVGTNWSAVVVLE